MPGEKFPWLSLYGAPVCAEDRILIAHLASALENGISQGERIPWLFLYGDHVCAEDRILIAHLAGALEDGNLLTALLTSATLERLTNSL